MGAGSSKGEGQASSKGEQVHTQSQESQEMYDKQTVDETLRNFLEEHIKETDPIKKKEKEIKYTEFYCKSGLSGVQKQICQQELKRLQEELRRMRKEDHAGIFSDFGGKMKSKRTKSKKSKRTKKH
jgi:uncharacterized protein YhaN